MQQATVVFNDTCNKKQVIVITNYFGEYIATVIRDHCTAQCVHNPYKQYRDGIEVTCSKCRNMTTASMVDFAQVYLEHDYWLCPECQV